MSTAVVPLIDVDPLTGAPAVLGTMPAMVTAGVRAVVELLGPMRVMVDAPDGGVAGVVRVEGTKRRLLLALLAADRSTPRSIDWLATQLWSDRDRPHDAATTVRVHVSRLRRSSSAPLIATGGTGYQLDPSVVLDVDQVADSERLAVAARGAGRVDDALDAWAEALGRWRGPALAEFDDAEELAHTARMLRQRRLDLVSAFADTVGVTARHDRLTQAMQLLHEVQRDEPFSESLVWRLVAAHARRGARQEAIAELERLSHAMGGLDPMSGDVLEAIVADDLPTVWAWERRSLGPELVVRSPDAPRVASTITASPPLPDRSVPLIGRDAALDELVRLAALAVDGARVVFVSGPAGIGKSRLLAELAVATTLETQETQETQGAQGAQETQGAPAPPVPLRFAYGRFEPEMRAPLHALRQALRWPDDPLPEGSAREGSAAGEGAPTTERVVSAAASRMAAAAQEGTPLVLLVDDLHDADSLTLLALCELIVQHPSAPVTVVCTVRDSARAQPLVRRLADRARRTGRFAELQLEGLDVGQVAQLLDAAMPDNPVLGPETDVVPRSGPGPDRGVVDAAAVCDATGGNPYLVRLLATSLQLGHGLPRAIEATSDAIGDLVDVQIRALGDDELDVLRLAAAAGRTVRLEVLEASTGFATTVSLGAVERLIGQQLLREEPGPFDSFTFPHELLRSYVLQSVPITTRRRLHGRVATAMEELVDTVVAGPAELASQWSKSHQTARSVPYFLQASRRASIDGAHAEAFAAAESGLAFCEQDAGTEAALQLAAAAALHDLGRLRDGDERAQLAWVNAKLAGDETVLTQAAQMAGGRYVENRYDESATDVVRQVLTEVSDARSRSLLLSRLVVLERNTAPNAASTLDEARRLADESGDDGARLAATHAAVSLMYHRPDPGERLAVATNGLVEATRLGRRRAQVTFTIDVCVAAIELGALDVVERALRDIDEPGVQETPLDRWWLLSQRCTLATALGDLTAAERDAVDGRELGQAIGVSDAAAWYFMQLWSINHRRGDDGALAKVFRRQLSGVHPSWRAAGAAELAADGNTDLAVRTLDDLVDDLARLPANYLATGTLAIASIAARAVGHPLAAECGRLLAPMSHLHAVYGAGCAYVGPISSLITTKGTIT